MARIVLSSGWKSTEAVLDEAFAALGCERWGGASDNGWSRISDLLRCPYRYQLKHVKKLVPLNFIGESSKAQDTGSFGHAALAAYYAGQLPDERYPGFRSNCPTPEAMLTALDAAGAEPMSLQEARAVWGGYIDHWGADGLTPMAVEMPAGDSKLHTCRYDLIASVEDSAHDGIWAFDHKVLSPKAEVDNYQLNGEILGEALCWKLSGLDEVFGPLAGVCINVLFKGKPPGGRAPYYRRWFALDEELIRDFGSHRMVWQSMIAMYEKLGRYPKSHYGCVAHFDDKCIYWEHCASLSPECLTPRVK